MKKVNERALPFVLKDKSSSYTELLKKLTRNCMPHQRIMKIASSVFIVLNIGTLVNPKGISLIGRASTYNLRGKIF